MKSLQEKGVEMSNQWGEISEERLCGESTILSLRVNSNLQTARKILLSALEYEFLSQFTIEVIRKWTLCFHLFFLQILVKLVNQGQFWNLHVMRIPNHPLHVWSDEVLAEIFKVEDKVQFSKEKVIEEKSSFKCYIPFVLNCK